MKDFEETERILRESFSAAPSHDSFSIETDQFVRSVGHFDGHGDQEALLEFAIVSLQSILAESLDMRADYDSLRPIVEDILSG